jgi:hypothetical protein
VKKQVFVSPDEDLVGGLVKEEGLLLSQTRLGEAEKSQHEYIFRHPDR